MCVPKTRKVPSQGQREITDHGIDEKKLVVFEEINNTRLYKLLAQIIGATVLLLLLMGKPVDGFG